MPNNPADMLNTRIELCKTFEEISNWREAAFTVGQYVCNIGDQVSSGPVRFVAVQSYDEATWEFTYGSSTIEPVSLPGYIFQHRPCII